VKTIPTETGGFTDRPLPCGTFFPFHEKRNITAFVTEERSRELLESDSMTAIYPIAGGKVADLTEVGGKGRSLMTMAGTGLRVPPGFILAVRFFDPWLAVLRETEEWRALLAAADGDLGKCATALKARAASLTFTPEQKAAVDEAFRAAGSPAEALFAVRSSSPEEDLEKASFAGVYETVLGVNRKAIESAVLTVFSSALDERAFRYKKQHGFDISSVRIAVVVQQQIASEVAGVGFSINPLTNCYDEAVINANWGLGESIVSGAASPDRFVVDKISGEILERHCGGKEVSYFLLPNGGTETRADPRNTGFTLTDAQVTELAELIRRVEAAYGLAVDIEWALSGGLLYLLQARPVTTLVPLPDGMQTKPGEPRRLYLDLTLVEQGVRNALTPMGVAWFGKSLR
jgi:pyruvate,water dikinase